MWFEVGKSLLESGTLKELARSFSETMLLPFVSSAGASGLLFFGSWPIKDHHNGEDNTKPGFAGQIYLACFCRLAFSSVGPEPELLSSSRKR